MPPPTRSEQLADVMAQVARGDRDAFAQLYDATSRAVFGVVLRVVRDRAQAEEVTQEVYVEAWRNAASFAPDRGSASAWLNTIAHRKAVDRVRSAERTTQREQQHYELLAHDTAPDPSEVVADADAGRSVRKALEQLPEHQRTALRLAYFEGRSQSQVAEILDLPLGTVKTRIRDAMKKLRSQLEEAR